MKRGDGRRSMYTEPEPMYRMDMDLYRMNPEELRDRDRMRGIHYYTSPGYEGVGDGRNTVRNGVAENKGNSINSMDNMTTTRSLNQNQSKLDRAVKMYTENKDMQSLEDMLNAINEKIMEEMPMMDANKKQMTKSKLTTTVNMIK